MNAGLNLVNVKIRVGRGQITSETLANDARNLRGIQILPGVGKDFFDVTDEAILRVLCYRYMQFCLFADEPIILQAQVARFPYSINGQKRYQEFAVRLMPERVGDILAKLKFNEEQTLSVSYQSITPDSVVLNVGGTVWVEVYFQLKENLPPLTPPPGFKEEVFLDPDKASD